MPFSIKLRTHITEQLPKTNFHMVQNRSLELTIKTSCHSRLLKPYRVFNTVYSQKCKKACKYHQRINWNPSRYIGIIEVIFKGIEEINIGRLAIGEHIIHYIQRLSVVDLHGGCRSVVVHIVEEKCDPLSHSLRNSNALKQTGIQKFTENRTGAR